MCSLSWRTRWSLQRRLSDGRETSTAFRTSNPAPACKRDQRYPPHLPTPLFGNFEARCLLTLHVHESRVPESGQRKMKPISAKENEAVIDRRKLLRILLLLGPFTALASACEHRGQYEETEEPLTQRQGGGY